MLILHFCKGNKSLFSKKIGVSPSVIGNITGEREGNPSFEVVQKISYAFVSVNTNWLLTGRGDMLIEDQSLSPILPENCTAVNPFLSSAAVEQSPKEQFYVEMYKEMLIEKDKIISNLNQEVGMLKERVDVYQKELDKRGNDNKLIDSTSAI